jgi:hypothetical protein
MVQGWYQGGLSVFDFTDSARPVEIAFFDRGPIDAEKLIVGGHWSTYWYNGHIYATEIVRGLDVFRLQPSEFLSASEIEAASLIRVAGFNAQQQPHVTWPSSPVVARAYLDQLGRTGARPADRLRAFRAAIDRGDASSRLRQAEARALADELDALAVGLDASVVGTRGRDAVRLSALAAIVRDRAAALRN